MGEFDEDPLAKAPANRPCPEQRSNNDEYYELDAKFLERELNKGLVYIEFEKLNGQLRCMLCTRNLHLVPSDRQPKNKRTNEHFSSQEGAVSVFEVSFVGGNRHQLATVKFKDWRSFRLSSVKKIRFHHHSISEYVRHAAELVSERIRDSKLPIALCL